MTRDALRNGPTWFQDYGLYGMQWGAQPVFGEVRRALEREPQRPVIISPVWTNGIVNLARFFLPYEAPGVVSGEKAVLFEPLPLYFGSLRMFMEQGYPIEEEYLFVITAQEYQEALAGLGPRPAEAGGQVEVVQIEKKLTYPNGQPGFYFVHLRERKD
jgi:hypothetical protein